MSENEQTMRRRLVSALGEMMLGQIALEVERDTLKNECDRLKETIAQMCNDRTNQGSQ